MTTTYGVKSSHTFKLSKIRKRKAYNNHDSDGPTKTDAKMGEMSGDAMHQVIGQKS